MRSAERLGPATPTDVTDGLTDVEEPDFTHLESETSAQLTREQHDEPPELTLFDVAAPTAQAEPAAKLSPDRRRTLRQHADIEAGRHPLIPGSKTYPDRKCGECAHRIRNAHGYPKCDLTTMSHSAASDVRASWPSCSHYLEPAQ